MFSTTWSNSCVCTDLRNHSPSHDITSLNPQVFADLLDPIIRERHNGYDPRTMTHPTDLDSSKVLLPLRVSCVLCDLMFISLSSNSNPPPLSFSSSPASSTSATCCRPG